MEKLVEIGGKNYRLRYTVNSMCAVEERAGCTLSEILEREFSAARILLWGGLLESQPEITLVAAGELIGAYISEGGTLGEMIDLCVEAMQMAGFFGRKAQA